jgi:hypothetical protein
MGGLYYPKFVGEFSESWVALGGALCWRLVESCPPASR